MALKKFCRIFIYINDPMKHALSKTSIKAQSAMEYLITYGWAFLVITVVISLFAIYIYLPSHLNQNKCTFLNGVNCVDMILQSNASTSSSQIVVALSNKQVFSLQNASFNASINGKNASGSCFYSLSNTLLSANNIIPGNEFYCVANIPYQSRLATINGNLYVSVSNCGFSQNYNASNYTCTKPPIESIYTGMFTAQPELVSKSKFIS
jgi:hypothetical protein